MPDNFPGILGLAVNAGQGTSPQPAGILGYFANGGQWPGQAPTGSILDSFMGGNPAPSSLVLPQAGTNSLTFGPGIGDTGAAGATLPYTNQTGLGDGAVNYGAAPANSAALAPSKMQGIANGLDTAGTMIGAKNGAIRSGLNAIQADDAIKDGFKAASGYFPAGLTIAGGLAQVKADTDVGVSPTAAVAGTVIRDGAIYAADALGTAIGGPLLGAGFAYGADRWVLPDSRTIGQGVTGAASGLYNGLAGGNH